MLRRVKSLLDTGEHLNVVDPDGGIHERRKLADLQRSGDIDYDKFPQLKPQPALDETVLPYPVLKELTLERMYEYVGANVSMKADCNISEVKKPGALRCLTHGYRLHAAGHVQSVMYNSGPDTFSCFFRLKVKPAMKTSEEYEVICENQSLVCSCYLHKVLLQGWVTIHVLLYI